MNKREIELLSSARLGDEVAIDSLLSIHKHLVVSISRKYYLMGGDKEDLIQEGMIGLFKAITTFDISKNDNFTAYAVKIIEREIITAIRRANTSGQQLLSESILLDNEEEITDNASPESDVISEENTIELTQEINDKLSPLERSVVQLYLKGYNYMDIAGILNKSGKSIDNALTRIKTKLSYLKERL